MKAAVLLAAPLLFNVIWMSIFWNGIAAEARMLEAERAERQLLSDLNRMIISYYEGSNTTVMWGIMGTVFWEKRSLKNLGQFREIYKGLIKDPRLNDRQKVVIKEANDFLDRSFETAQSRGAIFDKTSSFLGHQEVFKQTRLRVLGRDQFLQELFAPQEQNLANLELENERSQQRLAWIAVAGLLVNVLGTVIFAIIFMHNFKNRLQLLVKHAEQLGNRTAIDSSVSGNDELTVVDDAMRDSAKQLESVFSFKRMLTEMMAHDLRSPLTSALASLETVLARATSLSETETKRLEAAQSSVLRSAALVDDLLVLDSLETGNMSLEKKDFNIADVVKDCAEILHGNAVVKGITLNLKTEARFVWGDPKRVGQVLTNLISNAIKFAPKNSEVVVEQKEEPGELKLLVRDSGTGVKAEEAERIFEKYYRSDKHKEVVGTGLGLAICKMIVDAHEGRIGCLSNKGAIFWFTIPNRPKTDEEIDDEL